MPASCIESINCLNSFAVPYLDVGAKYEIYSILDSLAKEGRGIIVVSSEMPELLGISDRIAVMSGGRIAGEVDPGNTTQEKIMELAAKHLDVLRNVDFSGKSASELTDDEIQIIASRYNVGPECSIEIASEVDYGKSIFRNKDRILEALS